MNDADRIAFEVVSSTLIAHLLWIKSTYEQAEKENDGIHRAALKGLVAAFSLKVEELEQQMGIER